MLPVDAQKRAHICEAFCRAQMAGRLTPVTGDFPTTVSEEEVRQVLLPMIKADLRDRRRSLLPGTAIGPVLFAEAAQSFAGDAVAASFLLQEVLQLWEVGNDL